MPFLQSKKVKPSPTVMNEIPKTRALPITSISNWMNSEMCWNQLQWYIREFWQMHTLPVETQQEQNKTVIIYTQNQFTNDVLGDDVYRLRLPSEVKTYELKGVAKSGTYYAVSDFENILTLSNDVPYQQIDVDPAPGTSQKRLIEHVRTNYYSNDLSGGFSTESVGILGDSF